MTDPAERAKVPYDLSLAVCLAMEADLTGDVPDTGRLFT
jgi:hypothetical protein